MSTQPAGRTYYIDQWCDEVVPCDCSLQGWAEWLSKPDVAWKRDAPAPDGARFRAEVTRWGEDVMAVFEGGEWRLFNSAAGVDFIACRFGKGLGWDADNILNPDEGDQAIREWLAEEHANCGEGEAEYFAIGYNEPPVTLLYRANPPRLTVEGTVQ